MPASRGGDGDGDGGGDGDRDGDGSLPTPEAAAIDACPAPCGGWAEGAYAKMFNVNKNEDNGKNWRDYDHGLWLAKGTIFGGCQAEGGCVANAQNRRSLCRKHNSKGLCSAEDCKTAAVARGLCRKHGANGFCSTKGCETAVVARGLCTKHGAKGFCSTEGCTIGAVARGLCSSHNRKRKLNAV